MSTAPSGNITPFWLGAAGKYRLQTWRTSSSPPSLCCFSLFLWLLLLLWAFCPLWTLPSRVPPMWLLGSPLMTYLMGKEVRRWVRGAGVWGLCAWDTQHHSIISLYTLSSHGSTPYLLQFCSQDMAAWDKCFFSPSWGISEGSAHWVFWALNWGIWSDGENMWKIMGWNKCLHVWI